MLSNHVKNDLTSIDSDKTMQLTLCRAFYSSVMVVDKYLCSE